MAALGRELQRRGHRITFVQIPDFEPLVRLQKLFLLGSLIIDLVNLLRSHSLVN